MTKYKHNKRGSVYTVLGEGEVQSKFALWEGQKVVIYQGPDKKIWVRPVKEFYDGRFTEVE